MNSCNTLALAEFPLKRDVATDCGSQGPMSQQNTDGSGRNELHPQKLMQLVGFRDPNARKHEHKTRRRKGGTYPLSHLYGHFGLVRLSRLGHDVSWVKA